MAVKPKLLGRVVKIHASGIVETDKGKKSNIKAEVGDTLLQDVQSREVFIKKKAPRNPPKSKDKKEIDEDVILDDMQDKEEEIDEE